MRLPSASSIPQVQLHSCNQLDRWPERVTHMALTDQQLRSSNVQPWPPTWPFCICHVSSNFLHLILCDSNATEWLKNVLNV